MRRRFGTADRRPFRLHGVRHGRAGPCPDALDCARAGRDRHAARQHHRLERRRRSRRHHYRHRGADEHQPHRRDQRSGYYIFSSLQNGTYNVAAELQGFKKVVRQSVRVDVNTTVRVDLALEVGQMTEAVTVSAESPLLQTDRTDTGRIIESKMVSELPLTFNRNFQSLRDDGPRRDPAAPRALAVLQLAGLAAVRSQRPAAAWRAPR